MAEDTNRFSFRILDGSMKPLRQDIVDGWDESRRAEWDKFKASHDELMSGFAKKLAAESGDGSDGDL